MNRESACVSVEALDFINSCLKQGELIGLSRNSMLDAMKTLLIQNSSSESATESVATSTYPIIIDYTRTLKEMIKAGCYDWTNSDITDKNFPMTGKGAFNTEVILLHYNKVMKTKEVLSDMESKGLKPAGIEYLLAVGEKYPNLQREFPVVALGSVWQDPFGRFVPCLNGRGVRRDLSLLWYGNVWLEYCRFLAVRK